MSQYCANTVIKSLADVTRHADKDLLDISLTSTLYELLKLNQIVLYKIFHYKKQLECYQIVKIHDGEAKIFDIGSPQAQVDYRDVKGFEPCLQSKRAVRIISGKGVCQLFYPVIDRHENVASIFSIEGSANTSQICDEFVSGYFQIYQNYLNLLTESELDTLTGLLNRRTFERDLKKIFAQKTDLKTTSTNGKQRRQPAQTATHWLAITDIDFFKRVNDNFGHLYGDEVLILLANIMRKTFRSIDVLFRFGGEEFVIILRSTDLKGAQNALERFRSAVESFDFPKVGKVTISIGFVEISKHSIPTEILGHADEALYYSKDNGRNQTNQYEQLITEHKVNKMSAPTDDIELF